MVFLDFEVTAGNVHDSVPFWKLYERLKDEIEDNKYYVLDAGYKITAIARQLLIDGKILVMLYKRAMTKKGYFKKKEYI